MGFAILLVIGILMSVILYIWENIWVFIFILVGALVLGYFIYKAESKNNTNVNKNTYREVRLDDFEDVISSLIKGTAPYNIDGIKFEKFVAALMEKKGFTEVKLTKASGDYGVDVIGYWGTKKYVVQCKYYSQNLGIKPIQEVYAGKKHYSADVAVVATNAYFTANAKELAEDTGVLLWDRYELYKMSQKVGEIKEHNYYQPTHNSYIQVPPTIPSVPSPTNQTETQKTFKASNHLGEGKYTFGVNIPEGCYDLKVVSGRGTLMIQQYSCGEWDYNYVWLGLEDGRCSEYRGLSLPKNKHFLIDGNVVVEITKAKAIDI